MGKVLTALIGIFFALAGPAAIAWVGYWVAMDRPAYHVGWCPLCVGWGPGAEAQLSGAQHNLAIAVANERTLTSALNTQSAAVRAQAAAGVTALAKAETATGAYRSALARATKPEASLIALGQPTAQTPDACKRAEAVDAAFIGTLK